MSNLDNVFKSEANSSFSKMRRRSSRDASRYDRIHTDDGQKQELHVMRVIRLMFASCILSMLYQADAVMAAGVTSEVFVSRAISYTKGVDVGIPQPYGGIDINGCDGPVSVPRTIALGSWFSRIGTFIDLPTNAALVVSFGKPTEFDSIVVYGLANGAGEYLDVYARPDSVSAWTSIGQVQESVSVAWFGAVPYTISLADSGLTSVEQVKLVGQDAGGCYPGFDLMAVSGLIVR